MNDTEFRKLVRDIREARERQMKAHMEESRQGALLNALLRRLDEEGERMLHLSLEGAAPE